jgi:hypothetical protein
MGTSLLAPLLGHPTADGDIADRGVPLRYVVRLSFLGRLLRLYVGYFVFSALGGVVLGYIRFWRHDRWLHHGLSLAFAGSIFAALSLSALELPDLPFAELDATMSWPESLPHNDPFRLLSNDSNHW